MGADPGRAGRREHLALGRRGERAAAEFLVRRGYRVVGSGFLARRGDGEPGATVLWKGFQHLADLTTMYCIMRPAVPKHKKYG